MFLMKKLKSLFKMNFVHFRVLVRRYFKLIVSDPISFICLLLQAPIMVGILKLTCPSKFTSYYDKTFVLFELSIIIIFMGILNCYREITKERDVLVREYSGGLDCIAYVLSKVVVQAIISLFQTIIIVGGCLLFMDLELDSYVHSPAYSVFFFFLIVYLTALASNCIAIFISSILKNSDSAILPVLFLIIAQIVFAESLMDLPESVQFLSNFTIEKWTLNGLGKLFGVMESCGSKIQIAKHAYVNPNLGLSIFILLLWIIIPTILSILAVKKIGKQKRK